MNYMFFIRMMCARRNAKLLGVESLLLNLYCEYGLGFSELLPTTVGVFYFFPSFTLQPNYLLAGVPQIGVTNSGRGTALDLWLDANVLCTFENFETDDFIYFENTHSAGAFSITGSVFKVSYL